MKYQSPAQMDREESKRVEQLKSAAQQRPTSIRISTANVNHPPKGKRDVCYRRSGIRLGSFKLGVYDPCVAGDLLRRHIVAQATAEAFQRESELNCRVLMKDGVWLVPESERPTQYRAIRAT